MRTLPLLLFFIAFLAGCKSVDTAEAPVAAGLQNGSRLLGMTLVDPTDALMEKHQLSKKYPGPIIVGVKDPTFFGAGQAPYVSCSIWIVEAVAYGMIPTEEAQKKGHPTRFPQTVREMAAALVDCSSTPADSEKMWAESREWARQAAKTTTDATAKAKLTERANQAQPESERGKYVCRIVYNYPAEKGTMTTYVHFSESDMKAIRAVSGK